MGTAYEQQDFAAPSETRQFPHGRLDLVRIGGADIGRLTLEPGWRWSDDVKPLAGTESCEAPHFQVTALPSGHDAWVVGDQPVVVVDWWGASDYAKG
jgi:hypothetical protein